MEHWTLLFLSSDWNYLKFLSFKLHDYVKLLIIFAQKMIIISYRTFYEKMTKKHRYWKKTNFLSDSR